MDLYQSKFRETLNRGAEFGTGPERGGGDIVRSMRSYSRRIVNRIYITSGPALPMHCARIYTLGEHCCCAGRKDGVSFQPGKSLATPGSEPRCYYTYVAACWVVG